MTHEAIRKAVEVVLSANNAADQLNAIIGFRAGVQNVAALLADRDRLAAEVEAKWQPIETAPKDQFILLAAEFDGPGDWRIKMGEYRTRPDEYGRHWHLMGASWNPTHWMPLPASPEEGTS